MIRRWLVFIPGLAALFCGLSVIDLRNKINDTRELIEQDALQGITFTLQAHHHFDTLTNNLIDYSTSVVPSEKETLKNAYTVRHELIRKMFTPGGSFPSDLSRQPGARELIEDTQLFLTRFDEQMIGSGFPNSQAAQPVIAQTRELSGRTFDLGTQVLKSNGQLNDKVNSKMSSLLNSLWNFNLAFIAATLLLIALLYLQSRYAKMVADEVYETEENLNSALSKISTVDKEREALNSFVAAASHDLRQPLHALGLYLGALKRHVASEQGQAILQNSFRSTEALNHLLNSMLDLSKLDAGVVEINLAHIRLEEIFHSLRQTFQPEAQERGLALAIKSTDIIVHTDAVLLERILGNLASNALAYTDEGSVSIDAKLEGNQVRICVEDTGQGIPKSEQKEIFNEYYQLHNPERDRTKGLGLGLSIVKRLSTLLEIDLELDSAPSRGSTFVLKLACGQVESCHSQIRPPSRQPDTDLNGLSILVIDDEADVRESMATLLQQYRSEVVSVDSAESALAYIIEYEWVPDLIIADYRLRDDKKGDVAIQQVREEVNEDVPAMIITGDTSPERLREATASGFALMHKPVIASVLLDNVTQLIGEHA